MLAFESAVVARVAVPAVSVACLEQQLVVQLGPVVIEAVAAAAVAVVVDVVFDTAAVLELDIVVGVVGAGTAVAAVVVAAAVLVAAFVRVVLVASSLFSSQC